MNDEYNEGFSAYLEGEDFSDNPYPGGSTRFDEWASGWTSAEEEDGDCSLSSEESEEYGAW
jgi:hypothetical protein